MQKTDKELAVEIAIAVIQKLDDMPEPREIRKLIVNSYNAIKDLDQTSD